MLWCHYHYWLLNQAAPLLGEEIPKGGPIQVRQKSFMWKHFNNTTQTQFHIHTYNTTYFFRLHNMVNLLQFIQLSYTVYNCSDYIRKHHYTGFLESNILILRIWYIGCPFHIRRHQIVLLLTNNKMEHFSCKVGVVCMYQSISNTTRLEFRFTYFT